MQWVISDHILDQEEKKKKKKLLDYLAKYTLHYTLFYQR